MSNPNTDVSTQQNTMTTNADAPPIGEMMLADLVNTLSPCFKTMQTHSDCQHGNTLK